MYGESFLTDITFLHNGEILYSSSRFFNEWMVKKFPNSRNYFFIKMGKIGSVGQVYRPIWSICFNNASEIPNPFLIINTKNQNLENFGFSNDSLEIWKFVPKNGFVKTNLFFFAHKGEIWDIKVLIRKKKKKKNYGTLILLCGFLIRVIEFSEFPPHFNIIENESILINTANVFHWKLESTYDQIITGDITGKITILNLKKKFYWKQIIHNFSGFSPIGAINLFLSDNKKDIRFLISGCYDGFLKIWDILDSRCPLKQFYFPKRWITNLKSSSPFLGDLVILTGFDTGFLSFLNFSLEEISSQVFCHQGGVWGFFCESTLSMTLGGDGSLNLLEFCLPLISLKDPLGRLISSYLNLFNNSKSKNFYNSLQATDENFSIKQICSEISFKKKFSCCVGGNPGTLIWFTLPFKKNKN